MSWNYRVVRHTAPNGENYYGLHEVYYDQHGKIELWCETPEDTGETLEELIGQLKLKLLSAKAAAGEPRHILNERDLPRGDEGRQG